MVTRFYPQPISTPTISPTPSATWNVTSGVGRRKLLRIKQDLNSAGPNFAGTGSANQNRLMWQFITDPLPAQLIFGTVKGQFRCNQTNTTDDYAMQLRVVVINFDGNTVRGVPLETHTNALDASEFATSLTNRKCPLSALSPATLTNVQLQRGDRIMCEVGFRQYGTSSANAVIQIRDNAADLPEDETTTTATNSWIEFSMDVNTGWPSTGGSLLLAHELTKRKQIRWRG